MSAAVVDGLAIQPQLNQIGSPWQYKQPVFLGPKLWTANFVLRTLVLNKIFPKIFSPQVRGSCMYHQSRHADPQAVPAHTHSKAEDCCWQYLSGFVVELERECHRYANTHIHTWEGIHSARLAHTSSW